jgi:DNA-binding NarL/FixJ family response regulator
MDDMSAAVVGRDAELARLRGALAGVRSGRPAVVLVVGGPGGGKSSLVEAAFGAAPAAGGAGRGEGAPVLVTASGDEAETDLDYGVLDQLARGFPVDALTRDALRPRPGVEPHRVGAGVLRLVDAARPGTPLVVVVDDAQWADRASLDALAFAARRLRADPVLLCVACRPDGLARLPAGLVRLAEETALRIDLGPLGAPAVAAMARHVLGRPLPPAAAERLREHTAGNPLHTRTLLDELPYEALVRRELLPAPRSYAALVLARLATCRPAAQDLLTALAVLGARAPLAAVAAVAGVDDPLDAVDELVERGLARVESPEGGQVLAFPHGLAHASVAGDLSPSRLASLHAAAADVTAGDEALRHRLAAAHGSDPALVARARDAAGRLAGGGSRAAAARMLLDAAPLAATAGEREHLVAVAAAHLVVAGQPLGPLGDEVAELADGPHRSYVLGHLALGRGAPAEAGRFLRRAWEQIEAAGGAARTGAGEPPPARDREVRDLVGPVADLLAVLAMHDAELDDIVEWGRRALAAGGSSTMSATMLCHGLALRDGFAVAEAEMSALLAGRPRPEVALGARLGRGVVRLWANDLAGAERDLAAAAAMTGERSTFLGEVNVRCYRAEAAYRAGRWSEALDLAEAAASLVDDSEESWLLALPHAMAAFVLAGQGRVDLARLHAAAATAGADASAFVPARLWAAHATLRVAVARADHADAAAIGDRMVAEGWDAVPEGIHHWRAAHAEALVGLGRVDDARVVAEALADAASADADADADGRATGRRPDASVAAESARATAVASAAAGDHDAATAAFDAGLALAPEASRPFERAQLELAAGAHRRRSGQRRVAAELLTTAAERFEALGAGPWSERCAQEIERCGLRPKKRSDAYDTELTAQERLVARLVADGRTNREVATELVISVKTVEHHLSSVYSKLGLRSRTELAARLAAGGPADGTNGHGPADPNG